jgi:hypothetical protein
MTVLTGFEFGGGRFGLSEDGAMGRRRMMFNIIDGVRAPIRIGRRFFPEDVAETCLRGVQQLRLPLLPSQS